jgi:hypothetical protein
MYRVNNCREPTRASSLACGLGEGISPRLKNTRYGTLHSALDLNELFGVTCGTENGH